MDLSKVHKLEIQETPAINEELLDEVFEVMWLFMMLKMLNLLTGETMLSMKKYWIKDRNAYLPDGSFL